MREGSGPLKMRIPSRHMPRFVMRAYSVAVGSLRRNHAVFRWLFGFPAPRGLRCQLWDWTTLLLRHVLRHHLTPGKAFLDMGTGPVAVLGIWARRSLRPGWICAADHIPDVLGSARIAADRARVDIEIIRSSLFTNVRRSFDVVAFNAPYIGRYAGERLALLRSELDMRRWCGGDTGMETIVSFLTQAPAHLNPGGTILLGVNRFYVDIATIAGVAAGAGLVPVRIWRNPFTGAVVYRFKAQWRESY